MLSILGILQQASQTGQELKLPKITQYEWNCIEQLKLQVDKSNQQDCAQVAKLITYYLSYPSREAAQLHMHSNRLGTRDLKQAIKQRTKKYQIRAEPKVQLQFCQCCGFMKQNQGLKLCTKLNQINNIGTSTYLYFKTLTNLIILLGILTLLYSTYSCITNVEAYNTLNSKSEVGYTILSVGSKKLNQTEGNKKYQYVQCWIGAGVVAIWLVIIFILKYFQTKKEGKLSNEAISAADFTIVIENIPKDITKQQLQIKFNQYQKTITHTPTNIKKSLQISKISVGLPFYLNQKDFNDEQLQRCCKKYNEIRQIFTQWIQDRQSSDEFKTSKQSRLKLYDQYENITKQLALRYDHIGHLIVKKIKKKLYSHTQTRTTAFVTFQNSHAMKLVSDLNDPSVLSKIRYYLSCLQFKNNKFRFYRHQKDMDINIERAPQPEDIIWGNLGVPMKETIKRKLITYAVTAIMLGISFIITYFLSLFQQSYNGNSLVSLAISSSISVMNIIIGIVIRKLVAYERDYTVTKYQSSLAIKSICASLINSILIPMIVNYFIKSGGKSAILYGNNGLVSDVFMLSLTNSFLPPILSLVNPSYIINRTMKWYASRQRNMLQSNQISLNEAYQYPQFQVGYQYVYLVSLFLFTCFFVSLQPIISVFAICGMILMHWIQKHDVFNRMKRPVPGTDRVNVIMFQFILFGGFFYSLGSLTWSNFISDGAPKQTSVPNIVALIISIITILFPYRAVIALISEQDPVPCHEFNDCRILLSSEYDRLNPVTAKQAMSQYQQFFEKGFRNSINQPDSFKDILLEIFTKQNLRNHGRQSMQMNRKSIFQPTHFLSSHNFVQKILLTQQKPKAMNHVLLDFRDFCQSLMQQQSAAKLEEQRLEEQNVMQCSQSFQQIELFPTKLAHQIKSQQIQLIP